MTALTDQEKAKIIEEEKLRAKLRPNSKINWDKPSSWFGVSFMFVLASFIIWPLFLFSIPMFIIMSIIGYRKWRQNKREGLA